MDQCNKHYAGFSADCARYVSLKQFGSTSKSDRNLGRHVAIQKSLYSRHARAVDRALCSFRSGDPVPYQITAMRDAFALALKVHGIKEIIVFCRVSPHGKGGGNPAEANCSLDRQVALLRLVLPTFASTGIRMRLVRASRVSARGEDFANLIYGEIKDQQSVMVATLSVDRTVRSLKSYEDLSNSFIRSNNMLVSFLWDEKTRIRAVDALELQDHAASREIASWQASLDAQMRALPSVQSLGLIQPFIWIGSLTSDDVYDHISRQVRGSEAYCVANVSQYQGNNAMSIPSKIQETPGGRPFSVERMENWRAYAERYDLPNLTMVFATNICTLVSWESKPQSTSALLMRLPIARVQQKKRMTSSVTATVTIVTNRDTALAKTLTHAIARRSATVHAKRVTKAKSSRTTIVQPRLISESKMRTRTSFVGRKAARIGATSTWRSVTGAEMAKSPTSLFTTSTFAMISRSSHSSWSRSRLSSTSIYAATSQTNILSDRMRRTTSLTTMLGSLTWTKTSTMSPTNPTVQGCALKKAVRTLLQ